MYIPAVSALKDYDKYKALIGYALQKPFPQGKTHSRRYIAVYVSIAWKHVEAICTNLAKALGIYDHLMGNPPLITVDMASDSIISAARLKLWRVLEKARSNGTPILCASNSFDGIERFCKRTSLMSNG
uniref:Uncharacterized protein n=1 Tax=Glossina austeni TaxID=7395 RepID=A0A1A9UDR8_GLOAU